MAPPRSSSKKFQGFGGFLARLFSSGSKNKRDSAESGPTPSTPRGADGGPSSARNGAAPITDASGTIAEPITPLSAGPTVRFVVSAGSAASTTGQRIVAPPALAAHEAQWSAINLPPQPDDNEEASQEEVDQVLESLIKLNNDGTAAVEAAADLEDHSMDVSEASSTTLVSSLSDVRVEAAQSALPQHVSPALQKRISKLELRKFRSILNLDMYAEMTAAPRQAPLRPLNTMPSRVWTSEEAADVAMMVSWEQLAGLQMKT